MSNTFIGTKILGALTLVAGFGMSLACALAEDGAADTRESGLLTGLDETRSNTSDAQDEAVRSDEEPSLYSPGECYDNGPYSFRTKTETRRKTTQVYFGGSCEGDIILLGQATYEDGDRVKLLVKDLECDNTGVVLYTHGVAVESEGCHGGTVSNTVPISSLGNPKNFWVTVSGRYNSRAVDLPKP